AARIEELLLPGVERVAFRADLDVQLGLRRAGLELGAARAADCGGDVLGVDIWLHAPLRIAAAISGATLPPETTTATVLPSTSGTLPPMRAPAPAVRAALR